MQARYATYKQTPGTALCTDAREVIFFPEAGQSQTLSNADLPHLVLLGDVSIADAQRLLDQHNGGAARLVCTPEWRLARER